MNQSSIDIASFAPPLLLQVRTKYQLEWMGLHGASHWARVLENGLQLCDLTTGLRRDVVALFALLHDSCREDDGSDRYHGQRAGDFALHLHAEGHFDLDADGLDLLVEACRTHNGGKIPAHPTVMACWDSDRLDLPRIHRVKVHPEWLGTEIARTPEFVAWATERARKGTFPWKEFFTV